MNQNQFTREVQDLIEKKKIFDAARRLSIISEADDLPEKFRNPLRKILTDITGKTGKTSRPDFESQWNMVNEGLNKALALLRETAIQSDSVTPERFDTIREQNQALEELIPLQIEAYFRFVQPQDTFQSSYPLHDSRRLWAAFSLTACELKNTFTQIAHSLARSVQSALKTSFEQRRVLAGAILAGGLFVALGLGLKTTVNPGESFVKAVEKEITLLDERISQLDKSLTEANVAEKETLLLMHVDYMTLLTDFNYGFSGQYEQSPLNTEQPLQAEL